MNRGKGLSVSFINPAYVLVRARFDQDRTITMTVINANRTRTRFEYTANSEGAMIVEAFLEWHRMLRMHDAEIKDVFGDEVLALTDINSRWYRRADR